MSQNLALLGMMKVLMNIYNLKVVPYTSFSFFLGGGCDLEVRTGSGPPL